MEMLYQLSYNGAMGSFELEPVTYSSTEQVIIGVRKAISELRLAFF